MSLLCCLLTRSLNKNLYISNYLYLTRSKKTLDYSLLPQINEIDLDEKFVRGSGPGGSAVNTNSNCVVLTHKPSGIVVKCHISRCLDENRKIARETLISRLDRKINGENSLEAQKKAREKKVSADNSRRRNKRELLKSQWKQREGFD